MIELNLVEKKAPLKLPIVLGIDLNELNYIMLFMALVIWYVPQWMLDSHISTNMETYETMIKELNTKNAKIKKELATNDQVKDTLKAYQEQVEKLKARSIQVEEALKYRTNPKKVLEKIARSIPEEVFLNELRINGLNEIFLNGGAYNSRSLGEFITIINDSPYLGGSVTPVKQENKNDNLDGISTNYDYFELKGKIKNFDTRVK